jgi:hypothetical protein
MDGDGVARHPFLSSVSLVPVAEERVFLVEVFLADLLLADDELGYVVVGTAAVRMLHFSVVTGFAYGVWVVGLCLIATHEENIQLGKYGKHLYRPRLSREPAHLAALVITDLNTLAFGTGSESLFLSNGSFGSRCASTHGVREDRKTAVYVALSP